MKGNTQYMPRIIEICDVTTAVFFFLSKDIDSRQT